VEPSTTAATLGVIPSISPSVMPSLFQVRLAVSRASSYVNPIFLHILVPPCLSVLDVQSSVGPSIVPTSPNVSPGVRTDPEPNAHSGEWKLARVESKKEDLSRLIARANQQFTSSSSWSEFVNKCKDPCGDLCPDVQHIPHRAAHLLNRRRVSGATVATKSAPCTPQHKLASFNIESHQSSKQHVEFLCGEFVDMIEKGQWILLPAKLVLNNRNLRLSPLGVVPQRERQPRTICDYSFFLVNEYTVELCPAESMQFGRALLRIFQKSLALAHGWALSTCPRLTSQMVSIGFPFALRISPNWQSCFQQRRVRNA
jgi:hypothetical protein